MKAPTKGQRVTYITNWNRKGVFVFRQAIVHSCGKVQMVLTDAKTGEEMGRHFKPQLGGKHGGTFPAMTNEEATARCEKLAAAFLEDISAHYRRVLEKLGEPRAVEYHAAVEAIRAQA